MLNAKRVTGKPSAGLCLALASLLLAGCGSLATKTSQLHIGDTQNEVSSVMGAANYSKTDGDLAIWQYATIAGFGYCDYRRVWFWKGYVTAVSGYHHASIAGCSVGLKRFDWQAAMSEAPITAESPIEAGTHAEVIGPPIHKIKTKVSSDTSTLADDLIKLEKLHASGALTDVEFEQAKRKLLGQQ